jgi:formylglycine-generating enzyme required for sulfatase activity
MSADITSPVKSYFPNKIGVYNLIGNVAEMISEEGIAKGGSWINKPEEVSVTEDFHYTKPSDWLGFRCVCEKVN